MYKSRKFEILSNLTTQKPFILDFAIFVHFLFLGEVENDVLKMYVLYGALQRVKATTFSFLFGIFKIE